MPHEFSNMARYVVISLCKQNAKLVSCIEH